jgi:two-component system, response regulator
MGTAESVEILLVEDNPQDADLTIRALKKRNLSDKLVRVEDGVAALDYLFRRGQYAGDPGAHRPKVIFLDIKLPKLSGLEVLTQIRKNPETSTIPVVMVTSSREDQDILNAYKHGANSYVVKPLSYESFQEAVASLGSYWLLFNQTPGTSPTPGM